MAEILSKSQFARRCGVGQNAVSNWIKRRKLTAPALRADGTIDAAQADAQLGITIDPVMAASARQRPAGAALRSVPAAPAAEIVDLTSARQLLRARALSASIDAERKRRELEHERGKYTLTEEADAALARVLSGFLTDVEQSFQDLADDLRLDRAQLAGLRKWWSGQRAAAAAKARQAAASEPEFIEDYK